MKHLLALQDINRRIRSIKSNLGPQTPVPFDGYKDEAQAAIRSLEESAQVLRDDAKEESDG